MIQTIWCGRISAVSDAECRIDCDFERTANTPMTLTYYVGEDRATESEKALIDARLVHEYTKLLCVYEGVLMPLPESTKPVIDALKKLAVDWVKAEQ